jgi:hypothetical protein
MAEESKPQQSQEIRAAAAEAGMSPEKFVQLSGRTTLAEYEALAEAEGKKPAGESGRD